MVCCTIHLQGKKIDAVVSVASGEKTLKQILQEIGVSRGTLWKRRPELLGEGNNLEMGKDTLKNLRRLHQSKILI